MLGRRDLQVNRLLQRALRRQMTLPLRPFAQPLPVSVRLDLRDNRSEVAAENLNYAPRRNRPLAWR